MNRKSTITKEQIRRWLRETDWRRLDTLFGRADRVRRDHVGDEVHLRGLVEISSHCQRDCLYCGLRRQNRILSRYRLSAEQILACARRAVHYGYGTVVLQSGEDSGIRREWLTEVIRQLKRQTHLAVTLSLGERDRADLAAWRHAGADRYLLRFETANAHLYNRIHPPRRPGLPDRFDLLRTLRQLGYEVGSGVMVGIPGQTIDDLADDIEWFGRLDLDMIGLGPFLAHPHTPLGQEYAEASDRPADPRQVANSELMTYKAIALVRLVCPDANIPSTTALASLNPQNGREEGLRCGANVIMPNLTPPAYRRQYEIYPAKACLQEEPGRFDQQLKQRIAALGRRVGVGPGAAPHYLERRKAEVPS